MGMCRLLPQTGKGEGMSGGRSDGGLAGRPGTKKGRDQEIKELSLMSLRKELISLMMGEGLNSSQPSARFGISRKTGYTWMNRYRRDGMVGLADQSRRPKRSPRKTPARKRFRWMGVSKLPSEGYSALASSSSSSPSLNSSILICGREAPMIPCRSPCMLAMLPTTLWISFSLLAQIFVMALFS
jgi:hypothetical protein